MERSKTRWADQRASSACSRATKSMSGGTGVNTGKGRPLAAGAGAPATSERIEGMHRPPSAMPPGLVLAQEPHGDGELDLTAAMFDPPKGAFWVARRGHAAGPPLGGFGVRALHPGLGQ